MNSQNFTLYFKPVETEKELRSCYNIRYKVYCEEKRWLNASGYPSGEETDEYDEKALHYIAMDEDFKIVGLMRILRAIDFERLPYTFHPSFRGEIPDIPKSAELSRFIVTSQKNRNQVIKGLFRTIYQNSKMLGLDRWVILVEPSLLRYFTRFYYFCDPMATPTMYFGAFTLPAVCDIPKHEKIWKVKYPENYEFNREDYMMYTNTEKILS
ncbi:MAG: GNAT family N-acetyltransferase [Bacteroidales bacterium]|nr:GNAT family N-acetyltransferase [Bacteroidales bacterium]